MGTFSSGAGQIQFVGTAFAIVLALLIAPRNIKKPPVLVITAGLLGVLTCLAFSGSRATIGLCAVTGVFALGLGIVGRGGAMRSKAVMLTLTIGVAALTLYPIVFPEGFAALTERLTTANAAETRGGFKYGILSRALYSFIDFIFLIDVVPALGYGIGYGGNASNILGATVDGVKPALLAETDYSRQMVDLGPAFGIAYIGFRLALVLWMATTVLRATRQSSDPMPMLLLSYVAVTVGTGQITGQGAINFYGWFFAGVMLAACKHAVPPAGQRASAPRVKGVRFERMGARHRARFAVNPIAPPAPSHAGR